MWIWCVGYVGIDEHPRCGNCSHWNGKGCDIEALIKEVYNIGPSN